MGTRRRDEPRIAGLLAALSLGARAVSPDARVAIEFLDPDAERDMADEPDLVLPHEAYDALLARYPWIRSRDRYAYLSRGWAKLAIEMLDAMDAAMKGVIVDHPGAHVAAWYTKEKLAGLRVHFALKGAPAEVWAALRPSIDRAEALSMRTCELCGEPGRVRDRDGWYATRCDAHDR